ncbi:terminase large subunit domain-containing protein [Altericroceibacterium endophyticum]|uniref:Terminase n=1 Tax=Altericroceibacterium endophyticum TaxID=1808508 RepID=A0A6I4T5S0_9SPHN|nr:terminase family protein [Altericroceibacterium endophyticum]MXO66236.1 terminase [Altericroceibacterium endophyticum]
MGANSETVPAAPVIPYDVRRIARAYYWRGWGVTEIAAELTLSANTVQAWKARDKWDDDPVIRRIEDSLEMRLNQLIFKEKKSGTDMKEIDLLGRQIEKMARVRRYGEAGGHEGDLNPKVARRNKGEKKKKEPNNLITPEDYEKLKAAFLDCHFGYQEVWWANVSRRTRMLLKSRQIGATFYFAREAFIRALETGNNQVFISASRAQANIFRQYIIEFVFSVLEKHLTGDPMVVHRLDEDGEALEPVTFYFLGTNYRTAQGYHGDVYIDECFWIHGFEQINKVASAISTQKRYHKTYFSTPSTIAHEAYPMWNGERFNRRRQKADRVKIATGHGLLKDGQLGADGIWRHVVTIEDAIALGFDLVDIEELRLEYALDEFENLFLCQFVDDSQSSFPLSMLRPCMVDSWDVWKDFHPYGLRPFGDGEVWIGYDPAESEDGDQASCVVVAPPKGAKDSFRVLEKHQWRGKDFEAQAAEIRKLTRKYRVTEIAIDGTGMGAAVWQLVRKFFPQARRLDYSPLVKTQMVLKAKNVFSRRRIQFDAGWSDMAGALMSIHPQLTKGQKQLTYVARRSTETGHGDLAWALLHALYCEPMDATDGSGIRTSSVEINR